MPIREIMNYMNSMDDMGQLDMLLALHCAPIINGIKISNLVKLTRKQSIALVKILQTSGLSVWFLSCDETDNQTLVFRRKEMQEFLEQKSIQQILKKFGYTEFGIHQVFWKLTKHMKEYREGKRDFPHELGILLGYPIDDVIGFMENQGANYSYCGYWKVYSNIEQAKQKFEAYNEVRDAAVFQVLNGYGFMRQKLRKI